MPVDLAASVVTMAVECWYDPGKVHLLGAVRKGAVCHSSGEGARDVVPHDDVSAIHVHQSVDNGKRIFHSV